MMSFFVGLAWHLAAAVSAALLVYSGLIHARDPESFRAAVTNQGIVPFWFIPRVARWFTATQLAVGTLGFVAVAYHPAMPSVSRVPLLAVTAVYLGMAGYLAAVVHHHQGAPCGCFGGNERATPATVARALVLAMGPTVPAMGAFSTGDTATFVGILACMMAGIGYGLVMVRQARRKAVAVQADHFGARMAIENVQL